MRDANCTYPSTTDRIIVLYTSPTNLYKWCTSKSFRCAESVLFDVVVGGGTDVYKKFLKKVKLGYSVVAEPTPGLAAADAYIGAEDRRVGNRTVFFLGGGASV